ncbi:Gfo/Idh/MocA family protein [Rossellomorea aquimaris]|uniref:Putative dehydrogenase n=1 Tax=Rossellomorea aquimaris TaxID=189382 RepID=A0A366EWF6_9BACI|nr:Gfo/Idh/MocA family oxidoreductase [Rossellomorea aquimaris]RBP06732.1 putative dehydrogenase [Rossellomorea aquimaris]
MKIGVIGVGKMGEKHINALLELKDQVTLQGIFDNDINKSQVISEKYKIKSFPTMIDLVRSVDAISLCVPTKYHYELANLCLDEHVHLLIEKPITANSSDAEKIVEKAQSKNLIVQVGHIELYNPTFRLLMELLKHEDIYSINFNRLNPAAVRMDFPEVVSDLMIHDVYLLEEITKGDTIKEIYSIRSPKNTPHGNDHVTSILTLQSGLICTLTASYLSKYKKRQIEIITNHSYFDVDLINHTIKTIQVSSHYPEIEDIVSQNKVSTINISAPEYDPLQMQLLDFIQNVKIQKQPKVTAEDGMISLSIIERILAYLN